MDVFLFLLQIIFYIAIGYSLRKTKLVSAGFRQDLSRLVIYVSLPAFLINSMNFNYSRDLMRSSFDMVLLSFLCYGIAFLISGIFGRARFVKDHEMAPYRYTMSFSNVGFLGYPVIGALFGTEAVFLAAMFNLIFDMLQWTYGVRLFTKNEKFNLRRLINPAIIAILIGFSMFVLNLDFPKHVQDTIASLGLTATPLSMMTTGLIIAEFDLRDFFRDIKPFIVSAYRLLLFPLLLILILRTLGMTGFKLAVPVMIMGMPAAASGPIIASQYGGDYKLTSQLLCTTTILSMLSIPLLGLIIRAFL